MYIQNTKILTWLISAMRCSSPHTHTHTHTERVKTNYNNTVSNKVLLLFQISITQSSQYHVSYGSVFITSSLLS